MEEGGGGVRWVFLGVVADARRRPDPEDLPFFHDPWPGPVHVHVPLLAALFRSWKKSVSASHLISIVLVASYISQISRVRYLGSRRKQVAVLPTYLPLPSLIGINPAPHHRAGPRPRPRAEPKAVIKSSWAVEIENKDQE